MRVVYLLVLVFVAECIAQDCDEEDWYKTCLPPWAAGRYKVITNDTIGFPENQVPDTAALVDTVAVPFFREILGDKQPPCNLRDSDWVDGVQFNFNVRTFGEVSLSCLSSFEIPNDVSSKVAAIRTINERAVAQLSPYIGELDLDGEEAHPIGLWRFPDFDSQQCELERLTLYNVDGRWGLWVGATNAPANDTRPDGRRMYLNFIVVMDVANGDYTTTLKNENVVFQIATAENDEGEGNSGPLGIGTLASASWAGIPGLSSVSDMPPATNPAIIAMLSRNHQDAEVAAETLLPSNVAILALPMVMNLVPSSALKLKSWRAIIVYVLVTDFATTIPFMIKGIELIVQATKKSSTAIGYHTGEVGSSQHLEIWAGSCSLAQSTGPGIAFLLVGTLVLLTGIATEVLTHKRDEVTTVTRSMSMRLRRRRRDTDKAEEVEAADVDDFPTDDEGDGGPPPSDPSSWPLFSETQVAS
eukprot:Plantae.Rhodophyta-Rhodochaete_pulchella.ctg2673.p1 GENE.Plantae.Rhodophyta-Rhodochaete_pulchella.ctg2673~~Plantae.Rhodophyta-Rhodochaete_pulchella.ctg2673.p1  ORF type:complete len:471 (+),score=64.95 Plantae.Rhodophyta-Rhodochaete_pulchella.ctg2673:473-1885(+)